MIHRFGFIEKLIQCLESFERQEQTEHNWIIDIVYDTRAEDWLKN